MSKILHLNSYFSTSKVHGQQAEALAADNYEHLIFVGESSPSSFNKYNCDVLEFCPSPLQLLLMSIWPFKIFFYYFFLRESDLSGVKVIHAHTLFTNGLVGFLLSRKYNIPLVVTPRNTDVNFFLPKWPLFFRPLAKIILSRSEAVVFLSPSFLENQLKKLLPAKLFDEVRSKSKFIPTGVTDFWLEHSSSSSFSDRNDKAIKILFAGKLRANKNVGLLIEAVRELIFLNEPVELIIVGDGPSTDILVTQAEDLPVKFMGHIDDKHELKSVFNECDIFAMLSLKETFGLVYLEAMAQGLPVIYSKGQGFDGVFQPGLVGLAVDPTSKADVVQAIRSIKSTLSDFSGRCLALAGTLAWPTVARSLNSVYSDLQDNGAVS